MEELNKTIADLHKKRFTNEVAAITTNMVALPVPDPALEKRLSQLNIIVADLDKKSVNNVNNKSALDTHLDQLNKHVFKKQWHYLSDYHKRVKLVEYLTATVEDIKVRNRLIDEVTGHLKNGELGKKACVVYDHELEKVTAFPALKRNKETNMFEIKV